MTTMHVGSAPAGRERGIALIGAIILLVILTTIASMLILSLGSHINLTAHNVRSTQAVNLAEAGIAEALSRIRQGQVPDNGNPRQVTQIFLTSSGSEPALGPDSSALVTGQPSGQWLDYSTADRSPDALTIAYKTNSSMTQIYRYSAISNPRVQTAIGDPIFVITSTGQQGPDRCRIRAEVAPKPQVDLDLKAALVVKVSVVFTGSGYACGHNHRVDTPNGTGSNGRTGPGGCNEDPSLQHWELGSNDVTGIWSAGPITSNGAASDDGVPPEQSNQPGFYAGPWEPLGMSKARFLSWVGSPQSGVPANLDGVVYLDDNGTPQDQSGNYTLQGTGSGFLYVDGDVTLNAGFTYRGLIYVEGDVKLNGSAWILGGLIVRGKSKFSGDATVLYSRDAILKAIGSFSVGSDFVTISWREIPN